MKSLIWLFSVLLLTPLVSAVPDNPVPLTEFYKANNLKLSFGVQSSGCGQNFVDNGEDSWSFSTSCTKDSGSIGNMHDGNTGTGASFDCSGTEGITLDVQYNIDTNDEDFRWSIYMGPKWDGDAPLKCYNYSKSAYSIFEYFQGGGSLGSYSFSIPGGCVSQSPVKLKLDYTSDMQDFIFREEWLEYRNPNSPVCGDGCCASGENPGSCSQDCYKDFKIIGMSSPGSSAYENEQISFNATIKNFGTYNDSMNVEGALVPESLWGYYGLSSNDYYGVSSVKSPAPDCCPNNLLSEAFNVSLSPGETSVVTFTVQAPAPTSIHPCGNNEALWDDKYLLFAGLYPKCGDAYTNRTAIRFTVNECSDDIYCNTCLNRGDGTSAGNACDCNSECSSNDCGGGRDTVNYTCASERSWNVKLRSRSYDDSCGGAGYLGSDETSTINCQTFSDDDRSGYVCDGDEDGTSSDPCRKDIGEACDYTYECWDDDDGKWCNSVDECTDGDNGRDCGSNDDCDSERCDSTCLAKLAVWNICDENSDCVSGICKNSTCRPASTACGDGHCESDRDETFINCDADCTSEDCDSNTDCPSGYFCGFRAGNDPCVRINYTDECSNYNQWFCQNGDVFFCENKTNFYRSALKKACRLDKVCDSSTVASTHDCGSSAVELQIEDATPGVPVYKQGGDRVAVYILSKSDQDVTFDNGDALTLEEGICNNGIISLTERITKCVFLIDENATGIHKLKAGRQEKEVAIINNPKLLIITNKEKLSQRFSNNPSGVKALLSKAYEKAAANRGIVYDANMEFTGHPFLSFDRHYQDPLNPSMTDNSYSLAIAGLISEKCNGCENTIILGDDYVVPWYRREISEFERFWYFAGGKGVEKNIYTDIPYIQKTGLLFSNFTEMFKNEYGKYRYKGKNVQIILPFNASSELRKELDYFKNVTWKKGYEPDFFEINSSEVYCNDPRWFINLTKKALIIIGTEDSNRALKCYPFALGEGNDAAFLQPNLWDNREFAFIINSDNPLVLKEFTYMFDNESLGNLRSEAFYVYHIATEVGVYAALGVGVATIVLASGGTALPASVALAIDISSNIAFASKAADDCIINNRGWGGCAASFLGVIVPFTIKFVREVMPKLREASVLSNLDDVKPLLEKGYLNDLRGFAGNNIFTKNVWTADEHRWAAKGMDELLQGGKISEIPAISNNAISREGFTVSIRSLGRLKSDGAQISSGFIDGLRGANNPGHFAELQRGVRIMEEIPNTQTRAIGLSHTFNGKTTDLDVVAQIKGSNDAIVESVKTGAFRAQEIQKSISDLGIRKNSIAQLNDGTQLTIKEVNLEVEESISNQLTPELNELAERLGVGVKKFTAVR